MSKLWLTIGVVVGALAAPSWASAQDAPKKSPSAKEKRAANKSKRRARPAGKKAISLREASKRAADGDAKAPEKSETTSAPADDEKPAEASDGPRFQRVVQLNGGILTHFHTVLSAFGEWTTHPRLGFVWVPHYDEVGTSFAPYVSGGHWEVTEDGTWAWASDYDWGHIPFHYGHWEWTDERGWVWLPGTEWAPAWVVWRLTPAGYDYSAWAPTPASHTYAYDAATRRNTRDARFIKRARKGKRPLRFMFVFNQYLFDDDVARHVVWDPDVSAWLGVRSKTFRGHGASLRPASPSFEDVAIPDYWTPIRRLDLTDDRVQPFVASAR